ncbi:MAG: hypothetical protein OEW48_13705 [Phycisphaerae bacterium]|nr:hypothetical protein [Phycisphaerae bacterium]
MSSIRPYNKLKLLPLDYKASDNVALEVGANIFFGDCPNTFFGQFQNNSNIYAAVRYSF